MARLSARDETRLKNYETLLAREPKALVFAALASLYARKYEFEKAIDILSAGLAVYPNYFSARVLLAKCYIALDRFDDARAQLDQVLAYDPYNISALGVAGDELRNRGRFADARERYLKILEFEPENEEYAYKLELLETLMEGGPFAAKAAAAPPRTAEIPPVPAAPVITEAARPPVRSPVVPRPAVTEAVAAVPPPAEPAVPAMAAPELAAAVTPEEVDTFDIQLMAAAEEEPAVAGPPRAADEKLATLTLARIYEDQGLFLRAREVIAKVLEREPDNAEARRADEHLAALLADEESPTGESIVQLIKNVEAASGVLEADELDVWRAASAGVAENLSGFEDLTLARAVAAAAGLTGADDFVCLSTDEPAAWEFDLPAVTTTMGLEGVEEWDIVLPFKVGGQYATGVSVLEYAVRREPGVVGAEEFELTPARRAARRAAEDGEVVLDLKATVAAHRRDAAARAPAPAPEAEPPARDELAVQPERYLASETAPPPPGRRPPGDDDFLGWLDSIKLREI